MCNLCKVNNSNNLFNTIIVNHNHKIKEKNKLVQKLNKKEETFG